MIPALDVKYAIIVNLVFLLVEHGHNFVSGAGEQVGGAPINISKNDDTVHHIGTVALIAKPQFHFQTGNIHLVSLAVLKLISLGNVRQNFRDLIVVGPGSSVVEKVDIFRMHLLVLELTLLERDVADHFGHRGPLAAVHSLAALPSPGTQGSAASSRSTLALGHSGFWYTTSSGLPLNTATIW